MDYLFELADLLAQMGNDAASEAAQEGADGDGTKPGFFSGMTCFLPAMAFVMILYIMMMVRPQNKDQAKQKEFLANLKKNDRVVTAGGIIGTVANVSADVDNVTLRLDESSNAKMKVLKTSIVKVLQDDDKKDKNAD